MGNKTQAGTFRPARPKGRGPRARDGEHVPGKKRGLLRQRAGVAARYRLMLEEKAGSTVKLMARVLGVSQSRFYS